MDTDDDVWPDMAFNPYSVGLGGAIFEVVQGTGDYATYYTCSGKSGDNDDMTFRRCYAKDNACGVLYRGRLSRPEYRGYPNCGTYYDDELPLWLTQAWWTFGGYLFGFVDPEASALVGSELGIDEVNYFLDFPPWENMLEVTDVSVSGWPRSNWLTPVQDANFDFFEVDSVLDGESYNLEDSDIVGWRVAVRFDQSQTNWDYYADTRDRFYRNLHWIGTIWNGQSGNPLENPPEVLYILAPADHTDLNEFERIYVSVKETNPKFIVYKAENNTKIEVGVANFSDTAVTLSLNVPVTNGTYSVRLYSDDSYCADPVNGEAGTNLTVTNGVLSVGSAVAEILETGSIPNNGKLAAHHTYYLVFVQQ